MISSKSQTKALNQCSRMIATWCFLICRWSIASACSDVSGTGVSGIALVFKVLLPFQSWVKNATACPRNVAPTAARTSGFTSERHVLSGGERAAGAAAGSSRPRGRGARACRGSRRWSRRRRRRLHPPGALGEDHAVDLARGVFEVAEVLRVRGAGGDAGGLLAPRERGRAEVALVDLLVGGVDEAGLVRAGRDAEAAADADGLVHAHDPVGVLERGARGARLDTGGVRRSGCTARRTGSTRGSGTSRRAGSRGRGSGRGRAGTSHSALQAAVQAWQPTHFRRSVTMA